MQAKQIRIGRRQPCFIHTVLTATEKLLSIQILLGITSIKAIFYPESGSMLYIVTKLFLLSVLRTVYCMKTIWLLFIFLHDTVEDGEVFDFRGMRLDWFRLQVRLTFCVLFLCTVFRASE